MTWVLSNGNSSREFETKEEAEAAKTELAGLGTLTIETKESDDSESTDVEADYIQMPNEDSEREAETDGGHTGGCPACGAISDKIYRCTNCGHDLAGVRTGVGTGGGRP